MFRRSYGDDRAATLAAGHYFFIFNMRDSGPAVFLEDNSIVLKFVINLLIVWYVSCNPNEDQSR